MNPWLCDTCLNVIDWTQLHWIDWIILLVIVLSVAISLWRGFVREAISLAGWVAAFIVANLLVEPMAAMLSELINNVTGRYVVAYAILFVATLMLAGLAGILARQLVRATGLSVLDRVLGTVFGFARGVILILVLVFVARQLLPPQDLQWLQMSQLMPHLDMLADWAQTVFAEMGATGGRVAAL